MLVSGFPGRGYLSAASPMLVALCTCVLGARKSFHSATSQDLEWLQLQRQSIRGKIDYFPCFSIQEIFKRNRSKGALILWFSFIGCANPEPFVPRNGGPSPLGNTNTDPHVPRNSASKRPTRTLPSPVNTNLPNFPNLPNLPEFKQGLEFKHPVYQSKKYTSIDSMCAVHGSPVSSPSVFNSPGYSSPSIGSPASVRSDYHSPLRGPQLSNSPKHNTSANSDKHLPGSKFNSFDSIGSTHSSLSPMGTPSPLSIENKDSLPPLRGSLLGPSSPPDSPRRISTGHVFVWPNDIKPPLGDSSSEYFRPRLSLTKDVPSFATLMRQSTEEEDRIVYDKGM